MLLISPFLLFPDIDQDSFGRCPNGSHMSPSGDCEKVTDTKGMPRCPDGYHRSPDGDCERVTSDHSSSNNRNNDDEDEDEDEDNDNNERSSDFDLDFSNSNSNTDEESDSTDNDNNDEHKDCPDGFYRNFDGDCKSVLNNDTGNDEEIVETEKNSILSNPTVKSEGIIYKDFDKKHTFFDQSKNLLYMIVDSSEIVVVDNDKLVDKLAVSEIEDPVYNLQDNMLYFLDSDDKINVFDENGISYVDTGLEIDDIEYNPSNGYLYATSSDYGKVFVIDNKKLVTSIDVGLGQVDYLAYNPSNGYMYGVDKYYQKDIVEINGMELINSIPTGESTNIDYLAYNPSNGYMYGVDSYGGTIIVLDAFGIKGNISTGYKVDYLAYSPSKGYMYVVGNEPKDLESNIENTKSTSGNTTLASGVLQPAAQIQQFNQDTGSGPICCYSGGGRLADSQKNGISGFGKPTNGNITVIDGTKKIGSLEFENLIENIGYNPVDGFLYVLTNDPGKVSLINGTDILDEMELAGNPKNILFTPLNGLAYITKENNYEYSIDVYHNELLKSNIPIKYLYDELATNPSSGLVYMQDRDIIYLIQNGSITDKIILSSSEE